MAKSSGSGSGTAPVLNIGKLQFLRGGMRPESMDYARKQLAGDAQAKVLSREPIRVDVWPDGTRSLSDGRHRLAAAIDAGVSRIRVQEVIRGPRGGERATRPRVMRIPKGTPKWW